jgi:RecB family exonuclease
MRVRQASELSDLERMTLINMSYSRLDSYQMCPGKYYFSYIQKEESIFGPAAALGNVLHGVLEDKVGEPLILHELYERMDHHRKVYDPKSEITRDLMEAGREMLMEFVDRHEHETFDVIGKELPFEIVIGSALVRGYIDLVSRTANGAIKVSDFKSGKFEVAQKHIHENLQLGIYALATSIFYPGEEIYAELYYLRSGKRKGHLFTPEDIEGVYESVLEKVNTIINDRNFRLKESYVCSFCDHAKNGACPIGSRRNRGRW